MASTFSGISLEVVSQTVHHLSAQMSCSKPRNPVLDYAVGRSLITLYNPHTTVNFFWPSLLLEKDILSPLGTVLQ
jgi:hypothetical protein